MMLPPTGSVSPALEGLEVDEIVDGLRAWAAGVCTTEAAVELLVRHGAWLRRSDFRELLWVEDDVVGLDPEELAALTFLASASRGELAVLQLVVGLLGVEIVDPLAGLLVSLDDSSRALFIDAVARCGGWHNHHRFYLATGQFGADEGVGR